MKTAFDNNKDVPKYKTLEDNLCIFSRLDFQSMDKNIKPVVEIITRPFNGVKSKITRRLED